MRCINIDIYIPLSVSLIEYKNIFNPRVLGSNPGHSCSNISILKCFHIDETHLMVNNHYGIVPICKMAELNHQGLLTLLPKRLTC